jgi:hypothetical protein
MPMRMRTHTHTHTHTHTGSIDGKIRVWSVMDAAVVATVQLHQDMVTAVSFSLSGGRVMAGTMRGRVRFYDLTPGGKLEYVAQVRGLGCGCARAGPEQQHSRRRRTCRPHVTGRPPRPPGPRNRTPRPRTHAAAG